MKVGQVLRNKLVLYSLISKIVYATKVGGAYCVKLAKILMSYLAAKKEWQAP